MKIDKLSKNKKREFIAWHIIDAYLRILKKENNKENAELKENISGAKYADFSILGTSFYFSYLANKKISAISLRNKFKQIACIDVITLIYCDYMFRHEHSDYYEKINEFCKHLISEDEEFNRIYLTYFDIFSGNFEGE